MLLDRFEQPLGVCVDPECRWRHLPDDRHFERHNPPCAELFIGHDGTEMLCELVAPHRGTPHRGTTRPASR